MDRGHWGEGEWGKFRWGVFIPDWDNRVLPKLKEISGSDIWSKMLEKFKAR